MTNWPEWFKTARKKPNYFRQYDELEALLSHELHESLKEFDFSDIKSVLDVGCGDFRLKPLFLGKGYLGMDQETTRQNIKDPKVWDALPEFDLAFCSLVLVTLKEEDARFVIESMLKKAKWVFIYEETSELAGNSSYDIGEGKSHHNYPKLLDKLEHALSIDTWWVAGVSTFNPKWQYYLLKSKK